LNGSFYKLLKIFFAKVVFLAKSLRVYQLELGKLVNATHSQIQK